MEAGLLWSCDGATLGLLVVFCLLVFFRSGDFFYGEASYLRSQSCPERDSAISAKFVESIRVLRLSYD